MRTALLALAAALPAAASAAPVPVTADPVLFWNDVLLAAIRADRTLPPVAARAIALANIAMHDAVNRATRGGRQFYLDPLDTPRGDARAAASAAAHGVLIDLFPAQRAGFDAAFAASLALVPDGRAEAGGVATGTAAAALARDRRRDDGWDRTVVYAPSDAPGRWRPTPPGFANPALPNWPQVTPWVLPSGDAVRPPAPPALDSQAYVTAYDEVRRLGAVDSVERTAGETQAAFYWADGAGTFTPPGHWISIAIDVAGAQARSTMDNAALFGLMGVSLADAAIAAWDAKYVYDLWRPVTAIRLGADDGNPLTTGEPGWTPLVGTPPFPAYVSGHGAFSAAGGRVLELTLGDLGFCSPQDGIAVPITRCFSSFEAAVTEAGRSRIWGGIHFAFDDTAGQAMGRTIADRAWAELFLPVPTPAGLALFGLGAALLALRHQYLPRHRGCGCA